MISTHLLIRPYDKVTAGRIDVWVAASADPAGYGINSIDWSSAFDKMPEINGTLFPLDLSGKLQVLTARYSLIINRLKLPAGVNFKDLSWNQAPVTIWSVTDGNWSTKATLFTGICNTPGVDAARRHLSIDATGSDNFLDKPLLSLAFSGGGGLGGEADVRDKLKPSGYGVVENLEPVFYDNTRNMAMLDGYGNLQSIQWVAEGLNRYTSFQANYATEALLAAALDAATVKPGQWASCIADGVIGFGAPPVGIVTAAATFAGTLTGEILESMALDRADADAGLVDSSSFDALDVSVPYPVSFWTASQETVLSMFERMCQPVLATPAIDHLGRICVSYAFGAASIGTLDKSGQTVPRVISHRPAQDWTPTARTVARAERPAVILRRDQINFADEFVTRGTFKTSETYRIGNTVFGPDKAEWLYINNEPHLGLVATLPVWPTTSNTYWQNIGPPVLASDIAYADGDTLEEGRTELLALASSAALEASNAAIDAADAQLRIEKIVDNAILDKSEKPLVVKDYNTVLAEQSGIDARATAYGITTEKTTYDTAVTALTTYLTGLSPAYNSYSTDTAIVRATFNTKFTDVYTARQALLNKIAEIAGQRAIWDGVIGDEKPDDYATNADSMLKNGELKNDAEGWLIVTPLATVEDASAGDPVEKYFRLPGGEESDIRANGGTRIKFLGSERIFFTALVKRDGAATNFVAGFAYEQVDGSPATPNSETFSIIPSATGVWERVQHEFTRPPTATRGLFYFYAIGNATNCYVGGIRLGKTESGAALTVSATLPPERDIPADYLGVVSANNLALVVFPPTVVKGGASIRTDDETHYALSGLYGLGGTGFVVADTDGADAKGNITVASGSTMDADEAGGFMTVTHRGVSIPKMPFKLKKDKAPVPAPASGNDSVDWVSGEFNGLSGTTYVSISTGQEISLVTGQTLYGNASLAYDVEGNGGVARSATVKWRYALKSTGTLAQFLAGSIGSDFAAGVLGSFAQAEDYSGFPEPEYDPAQPGAVNVIQSKSGLTTDIYYVGLFALLSSTDRTVTMRGNALMEAKI